MKTLLVTSITKSDNGNWWFRGTLEVDGFIKSYLIQVTAEKAETLKVGEEVSVPKSLLKDR